MSYLRSLLFIILIGLTGCELEVKNIDLPDYKRKLVINSFISPYDSISYVDISYNKNLYGEIGEAEIPVLRSASVSDGSRAVSLNLIEGRYYFRRRDMEVTEGKTYELNVSDVSGHTVVAKCTIPQRKNLKPEIDTLWVEEELAWMPGYKSINAKIYITDPSGERNFYRMYCKRLEYYNGTSYAEQVWLSKNELFDDSGQDGGRIFANSLNTIQPSADTDSTFIVLYILQTDRDYYTYHKTLENYTGGDPFQETAPVFTNINGGLGIFASYSVDSVLLRLQ